MGVIMLQKSSMMSSRFSFLNCHLKTTYLLAINLNCDGCIPQKQFIVDDAIFISSDVLAFIMRVVSLLGPSYSFLFLTNIFRFRTLPMEFKYHTVTDWLPSIGQFAGRLTWIIMNWRVQTIFIRIRWCSWTWGIVYVKVALWYRKTISVLHLPQWHSLRKRHKWF